MENIDLQVSYLMMIVFLIGIIFTLIISFYSDFNRLKNENMNILPKIVSMLMAIVFCFVLFFSINLDKTVVLCILLVVGMSAVTYIAVPNSGAFSTSMFNKIRSRISDIGTGIGTGISSIRNRIGSAT